MGLMMTEGVLAEPVGDVVIVISSRLREKLGYKCNNHNHNKQAKKCIQSKKREPHADFFACLRIRMLNAWKRRKKAKEMTSGQTEQEE